MVAMGESGVPLWIMVIGSAMSRFNLPGFCLASDSGDRKTVAWICPLLLLLFELVVNLRDPLFGGVVTDKERDLL